MLRALVFVMAVLSGSAGFTADFRWTRAFAQGTWEAIIRNGNDASVNIFCPSGQADTTPGMFIETKKVNPTPKQQIAVEVVVDGRKHPFALEETEFKAGGRENRLALEALVRALSASRQRSFSVEFPMQRVVERFSLSNARRALGSGKETILEDCPA